MSSSLICEELCEFDLDVKNTDEFFEAISKKAEKLGYVTTTFLEKIKEREGDYPTALPVEPYPVAIPHCDPEHILHQFVAPVKLKNPIDWCEMANNDNVLKVRFAFVLGVKKESSHIELLQALIQNFQDEAVMDKMLNAKNKEEFLNVVMNMEGL